MMKTFNHNPVSHMNVILGYLALALLGMLITPTHSIGSTMYPAAGFAIGILVIYGTKYLPSILLGALLTNLLPSYNQILAGTESILIPILTALGSLLQAYCCYILIKRSTALRITTIISSPKKLLLVVSIVFICCIIAPSLSLLAIALADSIHSSSITLTWLRWWTGDVLGIVVAAPLTITILNKTIRQKRHSLRTLTFPMILMFSVLLSATYGVHHRQQQQVEQNIAQTLWDIEWQISHSMARIEEKVAALGRFYINSEQITAAEFEQFANEGSSINSPAIAYSWNQLLINEQIEAFEQRMSQRFKQPDFKIKRLLQDQQHEKEKWSVVVEYLSPSNQSQQVIGLDIMSEKIRKEAVLKAIASRQITSTAPINLVQAKHKEDLAILLVNPVYHHNQVEKVQLPYGFSVAIVDLTSFFEPLLHIPFIKQSTIVITDASNEPTQLYNYHAKQYTMSNIMSKSKDIEIAGRLWRVQLTPSEDLINQLAMDYDIWFSLFSILISIFVVYHLIANYLNHELTEQEINNKTGLIDSISQIQQTYINAQSLAPVLTKVFKQLIKHTPIDAVAIVDNLNEDPSQPKIELIEYANENELQAANQLFSHYLEQMFDNYQSLSKDKITTHYYSTDNKRVILFMPWNEQQVKFIAITLKRKYLSAKLNQQLYMLGETINSVSKAIVTNNEKQQAEQTLIESKALLTQAESIGNVASWKINHVTAQYQLSDQAYKILNLSKGRKLSNLLFIARLIHSNDRRHAFTQYKQSLTKDSNISEIEPRIIVSPSGETRYMHIRFAHTFDHNDQLVKTAGVITDVTDFIKQSIYIEREKSREQKQRDAIAELSSNILGKKNELNQQFNAIVQKANQTLDVARTSIWMFNDQQTILECVALVEDGQINNTLPAPLEAKDYPKYFTVIQSNNQIKIDNTKAEHCATELYEDYLKPLKIAAMLDVPIIINGKNVGVICVEQTMVERQWLLDEIAFINTLASFITQALAANERNLLINQLEQQQQNTEYMLNAMVDTVLTINQRGIILSANKAAQSVLGYTADELIGHNVSKIMPKDVADNHDKYIKNYTQTGMKKIIGTGRVVYGQKKSGETFPLRLSVAELQVKEGEERVFVGTLHDLTIEQAQQEQIHRGQKLDALGQLTGGIAHDFNNILGIIIGYTEMLLEQLPEEQPGLVNFAEQIELAGERARALIQKLRSFSTKEGNNIKVTDINQLLEEQQVMLSKAITAKNVLTFELSNDLWNVEIDESDFENGILNLCVNSMHAMDTGGEIVITTRNCELKADQAMPLDLDAGQYICVCVKDTGVGMDKQTLQKIFEPFFTTKGDKGTGLGLSQLYGFINQAKGSITVESKVGEGTSFKLYFPRSQAVIHALKQHNNSETSNITNGTETILIVDDEEKLRELFNAKLNANGYQVLTASNGAEALQILEMQQVALVLSDITMPIMDGVELTNEIERLYPQTKIQLMSGFSDALQTRLNTQDFYTNRLIKPFSFNELTSTIRRLLNEPKSS